MSKDLEMISCEVNGLAMVLSGLSNQLDNEKYDTLTTTAMHDALYAVSSHLQRISSDLAEMEMKGGAS